MFLETPESECVKRTEGLTEDDHGNSSRIQQNNEVYEAKINSIKQWCEQFGLVDSDGCCKSTLNQELHVQDWDQKDSVKDQALVGLKKVMDFKQAQFDKTRQNFKDTMEQQKSLELMESAKDVNATPGD